MNELQPLPLRDGAITVAQLIDLYMAQYAGRDKTRRQRLAWWTAQVGQLRLIDLSDDHLHVALEHLAASPPRCYAGHDADGKAIFRAKKAKLAPATINRYRNSLSGVLTWAVRRRIAPKGWENPARHLAGQPERNEHTRFLSDDERERLLDACKASKWPRLYLLVLLALTTGARKGELLGLRWRDIDLERGVAHVDTTKNGDPKVLPLTAPVVAELRRFAGALSTLVFASKVVPDKAFVFEERWRQALRAARIRSFRFHDLRHTCASWLAQRGATLLEIGDLLGHRNVSMTKRYSHLASSHRASLVNRMLGDLR